MVKNLPCECRRYKRRGFSPWIGRIPWRRAWQPTPVFLPGESHGQRSLAGYSLYGRKELDTTEATLHAQAHLTIENIQMAKEHIKRCSTSHAIRGA